MKIVLNRPDAMNALSRDMMTALSDALEEAAGNRSIGCVVVRGAGDKAFCAGGDVKSMAAGRDQDKTYEDKVHDIRERMKVSELLHEMGKPTIAMVNGVAAGARNSGRSYARRWRRRTTTSTMRRPAIASANSLGSGTAVSV